MARTPEIQVDTSGSVTYDPPDDAKPSAATYRLLDPAGTVLLTSTNASIDSVSTTLAADVVAGAQALTVASAAGISRRRTYLITSSSGDTERVTVARISGTTLTLREPLAYAYSSGATFDGLRITCAVSSTYTDTRNTGFQCLLTYTANSVSRTISLQYDVVRVPWPAQILTPERYKALAGPVADETTAYYQTSGKDFEEEIESAELDLRDLLLAQGYTPSLFRSFTQFEKPVMWLVNKARAELGFCPRGYDGNIEMWYEICKSNLQSAMDIAKMATRSYDEDNDGALSATEKSKLFTSIQLGR